MEFTTVQGDVAEQRADALVNAAGTSLHMGRGVAGALRRAVDGPINDVAMAKGPIDLGVVAVTEAYELDADYVIHAAVLPHYGDGRATEGSIRTATRNAVAKADELRCGSLVIPILGTGAAGFPVADGTRFLVEEVPAYEPMSLAGVRVIAFADDEFVTMESVASEFDP